MEEATVAYLTGIEAPDVVIARANWALDAFRILSPEVIHEVFVSDAVDKATGERAYESICAFGDTFWFQSREFLTRDNADIAPYANAVTYVGIESEGLAMSGPSASDSRLVVEVETGGDLYTRLSAHGANCERLLAIVR